MVDFGGWDMPVNYGSQIDEHRAVRGNAGMFDVSHMRVVDVAGAGARAFLRYVLANNVDKLQSPGKALYSCLLKPDGTVLDDLIVYFFRDDYFRIVVNAGTADKDIAWLQDRIAEQCDRSPDDAAPRPRDHRRPGAECGKRLTQGAAGGRFRRVPAQAVSRRLPRRRRGGRDDCAHRLYRRGRLRNRAARGRRRGPVVAPARLGRGSVRPRRARHAAPRSGHESLRTGHGRDRVAARVRSCLDGRSYESARFHRQGGAAGAPRVAAAGRPRARRQGRRAAGASDRAYRSGRR